MPVLVMLIIIGLGLLLLIGLRFAEHIGNFIFKIFINPLTIKYDDEGKSEESENINEKDGV